MNSDLRMGIKTEKQDQRNTKKAGVKISLIKSQNWGANRTKDSRSTGMMIKGNIMIL